MRFVNFYMVLSFVLLSGSALLSQEATQFLSKPNSCYQSFIDAGRRYMNSGKYGQAIIQYLSAFECDDYSAGVEKLNELISNALYALNQAKEQAEAAEKLAVAAKAEAEQRTLEAIEARQQETVALNEVKVQSKRAESMLLSSLARQSLQTGNYQEALVLAYTGLRLSSPARYPGAIQVFGKAVKEALGKELISIKDELISLKAGEGNNRMLAVSKQHLYFLPFEDKQMKEIPFAVRYPWGIHCTNNLEFISAWANTKQVQVRDFSGKVVFNAQAHAKSVITTQFSNDYQYLLTCARDSTATIHHISQNTFFKLKKHQGIIYQSNFSPKGTSFFTRSAGGIVRLFDLNGKELSILGDKEIYIHDAAYNDLGDKIVTGSARGVVKVWDISGKLLSAHQIHSTPVKEVQFLKGLNRIISRSNNAICISTLEGTIISTIKHGSWVGGMKVSETEKIILSWGNDQTLKLSNQNGEIIQQIETLLSNIIAAEFSSQDSLILCSLGDGTYQLWSVQGVLILDWQSGNKKPVPACFTNNNTSILTVEDNNQKVMMYPVPDNVYNAFMANTQSYSDDMGMILKKYQLEFISELY